MIEIPEGFRLVDYDDLEWFVCACTIVGKAVSVRVPVSKSAEILLPGARAICSVQEELTPRYANFLGSEAQKRPTYRAEILNLEIENIDFVNPARPETGEVAFSESSGGEIWTCLLVDGVFCFLSMDT